MATEPETEGTLLASLPKNAREEVRIHRTVYRGTPLVSVRVWYRDGEEFKPGKGLALRLEQLPDLRKALQTAEKALKAPEAGDVRRQATIDALEQEAGMLPPAA